jgi:hypothetical protein
MLFYKKLVKDLQAYGFELNPYDPCVANKMVDGTQMTVSWHVDDLKVSHENEKNVTEFLKWVTDTYGQYGEVKTTRGKLHDYLGMTLNYKVPGQVTIDMRSYVDQMKESFPETPLQGAPPKSPWTKDLFKVDEGSMLLEQEQKEQFHTTTAQELFLTKRARPDIGPAIAFFTTRVRAPTKQDWEKLVRMMKFLISTRNDCLTLQADGSKNLYWHVDASFAVHGDLKSHTGGNFTMGKGTIAHVSRKQSLNTRSSTEAELVAADDLAGPSYGRDGSWNAKDTRSRTTNSSKTTGVLSFWNRMVERVQESVQDILTFDTSSLLIKRKRRTCPYTTVLLMI